MNKFMKEAIKQAKLAEKKGEVPVGAVAVLDGKIIARAYNKTISTNDPSAHAEILVLKKAGKKLKNHRLNNLEIYTTKEPCLMCVGALVNARVKKVYFGSYDPVRGGIDVYLRYFEKFNHHFEIQPEVDKEITDSLLKDFFSKRRGTEVAITGSTRNRLSRGSGTVGSNPTLSASNPQKDTKDKNNNNNRRGVRVV